MIILIIDTSNSKVLSKYVEKNAIKSDGLEYQMISIDTANYMLAAKNRAFGIRISHRAGNNYSEDALSLYSQKNNKMLKLLSGLIVNSATSEINQSCDAKYTDSTASLSISPLKTNGLNNINVKTIKTISIETPTKYLSKMESNNCDRKAKITKSKNQLIFNNGTYSIPKKLKSTMWQ